ncbi:MAG: BTAD domain-containing putative transcriptional regulator [Armatimonas sp.]
MVRESLSLRLLGTPLMTVGGEALPRLRSRKSLHLLALLALKAGAAVERDFLIGTLWPESNQSAGQESLKKTLADLRTALGSEAERLCTPGRGQLRLDLSGGAFCDILTFDLAMARFAKTGDPSTAEDAVTLYRGPLLEGANEDWILGERALRERSALEALELLGRRARDLGESAKALTLLRRAERIDPLNESVQRELIQTLAASGDINAARRTFRELRLRLHEELRQEPSAATRTLMQRLTEAPTQNSPASAGAESFPRFATPLIGREAELEAVRERLSRGVLTTLVGIGGMGKTRLATALARSHTRAIFIDLALLPAGSDTDTVARAIAQALGQSGAARLRNLLACDEALIVLDNCEHLIEGVRGALRAYLPEEAAVRILATSREPLGLRGEQVVYLETLSAEWATRLFRERAQDAGATLTEAEEAAITRICTRLDGLPLAIELAAARCGALSPQELLRRLDEPLRVLSTRQPDLPERQRTMRATLDDSWATLSEEEQNACAVLSVFVAPFTIEDAAAVIEVDEALDTVLTLHARSLLTTRSGGWTFLQPVRVYAAEKLAEHPDRKAVAHSRHAEHLAALSEREQARHYSDARQQAFRRMIATRQDRDAALLWATSHDLALFVRLALPQVALLRDLGFGEDARALIRTTWELTTDPDIRATLKLEESRTLARGQQAMLEEAIALAQRPATRAPILFELARLIQTDRKFEAIPLYERCLADCLEGGNLYLTGFTAIRLNHLVPSGEGEARARVECTVRKVLEHVEDIRQAARRSANRETEATALRTIGNLHYALGQKEESVLPFQRVTELWREADDRERTADALRTEALQWALIKNRAETIRTFKEGFALSDTLVNREEQVLSRCYAATAATSHGWFGVVRHFMDQCLPYLHSCSPAIQAPALGHLSVAYYYSGSGHRSEEYIRRCRELRIQMGDEQMQQHAERMLALTLIELGELTEARTLLDRLYRLYTSQEHMASRCIVLILLARAARKSGDWAQGHAYLEETDALYPGTGSYHWDRRRLEGAMLYRAQGDLAHARQELDKFWQTPSPQPHVSLEAQLTGAWLDLEEGFLDKAAQIFSATRDEALPNENLLSAADAENGLAEVAGQQGRDTDATTHAQEAARLWAILDRPRPIYSRPGL